LMRSFDKDRRALGFCMAIRLAAEAFAIDLPARPATAK